MNPEQYPSPVPETNPQPATPQSQPVAPTLSSANPLAAMQPGEQIIAEISRHPVGLLGTYLMGGLILLVAAIAAVMLPSWVSSDYHHDAIIWSAGAFVFLAFFVFLAMYISAKVYKGNRWIVTSDSLTQISQNSLFGRQSSQLSLHNLEDVTVQQNGIFQTSFNFGTLRAETAGERSKFVFPFCPDPNSKARDILMAREKFMGDGGYPGRSDSGGVNINTQA
jgi:hypothetical protein